ncbi:MAG: hypothetical protein JSW10_01455 [Pseudomonadota bacterium]|nr:MAG: hypothetical protein JSW10_01455 [Pseudomonadota bacterium]
MTSRTLGKIAFTLFTLLSGVMTASAALANSADEWRFRVYLDDKHIGYHNFRLTPTGDLQALESTADFKVKFLMLTVYRYSHASTELWQRGCLRRIYASTDDNGDLSVVRGVTRDDSLMIYTTDGAEARSGCVKTFAYWDRSFLKGKRLLNSQTGEHIDIEVEPLGETIIEVRDKPVPARGYRLLAEDMVIDLWYSANDRWLALQSTTESGRKLRYLID